MFSDQLTPAESARLLRDRAAQLARADEQRIDGGDQLPVVSFRLGQETVAIAVDCALELWVLDSVTAIPSAPPHFLGVTNLRGQVTAIVDLCVILGIERAADSPRQALALGHDVPEFAIAVDAVDHVVMVRRTELVDAGLAAHGELVMGVTAAGVLVLDGEQLLNCPALYIDEVDWTSESGGN